MDPGRTTLDIERIVVLPPGPDERFDLATCFERAAPTEMEIGVGKAGFILREARAHPERNYLGIEWANQYYRHAADRLARWGVTNVRIMRTDARHFVIRQLADASLAALHVYHPDPWPKTRHHKRRLFQPAFVQAVGRVLEPGGRAFIQTDHAEYFAIISALVSGEPALEVRPEASGGRPGAETNFEIKYRREGRSIYRLEAVRRADARGSAAIGS